jgi:hypothetical protein
MSFVLPVTNNHIILQLCTKLTNYKEEYNELKTKNRNYKTQIEKIENCEKKSSEKINLKIAIIKELEQFVLNNKHTFSKDKLKLYIFSDDRIKNNETWCTRNNINHLSDDVYFIKNKSGDYFFGVKIDNTLSFKLKHLNKIKEILKFKILKINEKFSDIRKNINNTLTKIEKTFQDYRTIHLEMFERKNENITNNLKKIKTYKDKIDKLKSDNEDISTEKRNIRKNILTNNDYVTELKKSFASFIF